MRYQWVMLALVWLLCWVFGAIARSISPLVTPILEDLNISYSQMGVILGAWPLTYIVVAVIGGAIIDRWGIRKSLLAGIIIIGLSEILRYFANGFIFLFLFVANMTVSCFGFNLSTRERTPVRSKSKRRSLMDVPGPEKTILVRSTLTLPLNGTALPTS